MKDDKVEDVSPEYISAKEVEKKEESFPVIPLPPDNVLKSAFLTAIKYRTVASAFAAYNSVVREKGNISDSFARSYEAKGRELEAYEILCDAPYTHERKARTRRALLEAESVKAEAYLAQQKHEAHLAKKLRAAEKHHNRIQHEQLMKSTVVNDMSEEEQEAEEFLRDGLRPLRIKALADMIRSEGVTEEESKRLDEMVEKMLHQS